MLVVVPTAECMDRRKMALVEIYVLLQTRLISAIGHVLAAVADFRDVFSRCSAVLELISSYAIINYNTAVLWWGIKGQETSTWKI